MININVRIGRTETLSPVRPPVKRLVAYLWQQGIPLPQHHAGIMQVIQIAEDMHAPETNHDGSRHATDNCSLLIWHDGPSLTVNDPDDTAAHR